MFIVRFLRNLLAVPFVLGGVAASVFSPAWSWRLWHAAWRVGLDPRHAFQAAIQALKVAGPPAAMAELETTVAQTPSSLLWAYAGLLRLDLGDVPGAETCLEYVRQLGSDPEGLSELLEIRFVSADPQRSEAASRLAESLETRRDVSGLVTRLALRFRTWDLLAQRRFDEAMLRVQRVLNVSHDPVAEVAGWAIDLHAGRLERARQRLARCTDMPPAELVHLRSYAAVLCGLDKEAAGLREELLARCTSERVAEIDELRRRRGGQP